ncbi:DUF2634 domain-containing protein [Dysosmobacter sp.]
MTELFPSIQPEAEPSVREKLPLCREAAWDFARGIPIYAGGRPVTVTGAEAVRVWCWRALKTARFRHDIYTWDYGCEAESLVGRPFTDQVKESEAARYVREALRPNPYIKDVRQVDVAFQDTTLTISCTVTTIYGEVQVHV